MCFGAHLDEVDLGECLVVARLLDVEDRDDVLVVEVPQQLHLSQCSQTEHGVVEWCNLLDSHLLAGRLVQRRADRQLATAFSQSIGYHSTYQTTPYAPSPTTSWMSYCSDTLKEIFLELPLPAGGMTAAVVACRLGYKGFRSIGGSCCSVFACSEWVRFVNERWMADVAEDTSTQICDHYLSVQEQGR